MPSGIRFRESFPVPFTCLHHFALGALSFGYSLFVLSFAYSRFGFNLLLSSSTILSSRLWLPYPHLPLILPFSGSSGADVVPRACILLYLFTLFFCSRFRGADLSCLLRH